ncbi:HAD family hydrolase [Bacillus sp. EAC]|uniref:HAD family hydrolase n=1 Tax=Bacillus sp. EAC TaxID=1978338 RepID=UPI000B449166|nr:HAD-IA family hydrolase [Bacillus sp. EAC]
MIKVVLFDLDGTLLNRDASLLNFIEQQYVRFNSNLNHIKKEKYISRFIELDSRGYVWKDKVFTQLINEYNLTDVTMNELLDDYISQFKHHCVPFDHLITMLKDLKNKSYHLGIISNGRGKFQLDNIKALGIDQFFDCILISETEGVSKPNPEIFKKAIDYFDVLPEECVFIGDHPKNDYFGAKNVGMSVIWKKDLQWGDFEPAYSIDDLSDIISILDKIASE